MSGKTTSPYTRGRTRAAALLAAACCLVVLNLLYGDEMILQEGGLTAPNGGVTVPSNAQDLAVLSPKKLAEKEQQFDEATKRAIALKAQYDLAKRAAVSSKRDLTAFKLARIEAHKRYVHKAAAYMEIKKSAVEQKEAQRQAKAAEVATKAAERAQAKALQAQHKARVFNHQAKQDKVAAMREVGMAARHASALPVPVAPVPRSTWRKLAPPPKQGLSRGAQKKKDLCLRERDSLTKGTQGRIRYGCGYR